MSAAQVQALRDEAQELDQRFLRGDKAAGLKARKLAIRASELEAEERAAPVDVSRQALELRLRLQAPLRSKTHAQDNELDTPLFAAAASPSLF